METPKSLRNRLKDEAASEFEVVSLRDIADTEVDKDFFVVLVKDSIGMYADAVIVQAEKPVPGDKMTFTATDSFPIGKVVKAPEVSGTVDPTV